MIAGRPGSGKSLVALDYAIHADVSCLYFSADTDDTTVWERTVAMRLNEKQSVVESWAESGDEERLVAALQGLDNIRFVYDPNPTLDAIDGEIKAWVELYGKSPDLIVIDNLLNVVYETSENEWTGLRHLMAEMHAVARQSGSALFVLHHTSEGEGKATEPPTQRSVMGKVSHAPELVLTVAIEPDEQEMRLCAVKNRAGKSNASAREGSWVRLDADLSRMTLREKSHAPSVADWWDGVN